MSDQDRVDFIVSRCDQLMELLKKLINQGMSTTDTLTEIQLLHKEYTRITGRSIDINPNIQKSIADAFKKNQ